MLSKLYKLIITLVYLQFRVSSIFSCLFRVSTWSHRVCIDIHETRAFVFRVPNSSLVQRSKHLSLTLFSGISSKNLSKRRTIRYMGISYSTDGSCKYATAYLLFSNIPMRPPDRIGIFTKISDFTTTSQFRFSNQQIERLLLYIFSKLYVRIKI